MDSEQSNGSYIWEGQFVKKVKTNDSTRYWRAQKEYLLKESFWEKNRKKNSVGHFKKILLKSLWRSKLPVNFRRNLLTCY